MFMFVLDQLLIASTALHGLHDGHLRLAPQCLVWVLFIALEVAVNCFLAFILILLLEFYHLSETPLCHFTHLFEFDMVFDRRLGIVFCFSPQLGSERRPLLHNAGA